MSDDELTEPVDWVGTPADATAIMRAVLQAVTDYRVTHFRGPSELRLADSDWDTIVGNTATPHTFPPTQRTGWRGRMSNDSAIHRRGRGTELSSASQRLATPTFNQETSSYQESRRR